MPHNQMTLLIDKIIVETETIAVVGISPNPSRASHQVAKYLQNQGFRIIPVNPGSDTILNETTYASLSEVSGPIDLVLIFRRPEFIFPIVEEAVKLNPKFIWMQEGIIHVEAAQLAAHHGIPVVMDHCMLKEHSRRN